MAQLLIANVNDGERSRTSSYTAGDIIDVRPDGFTGWGRCECELVWAKDRDPTKFPNDFLIIEVDITYDKAKALQTSNAFPFRISNYNLDMSLLPTRSKDQMTLDDKRAMLKGGKTRHSITAAELDICLLPRFGTKKPSEVV